MSDVVVIRNSEVVAAEINTIKENTRRIMIANAIRIGEKLTEAKSMVPFGEWGKWLEEKVEYSQSTAEDLMKMYREYGTNQESLFDTWTKSETFGNLSYSKHLALLALPFAVRQSFAEENDVENMSTREVQSAVQAELEAAREKNSQLERALIDAQEDNEILRGNLDEMRGDARDAEEGRRQTQKQLEAAKQSEKSALEQVEKLKKQLESAKRKEQKAKDALKQAQENPEIPETVMELMRSQVEADAAAQATADLKKQLVKAQEEAEEAAKAKERAEKSAQELQEKLTAAERTAKMQNPNVAVFQSLYIQLQEAWNRTFDAYQKVWQTDDTSAANCYRALDAAIQKFRSDIAGQV